MIAMMESKGFYVILLVLAANVLLASCYKIGPPVDDPTEGLAVCTSMTPKHGTDENKDFTADKYKVELSQTCFNADSKIQVRVVKLDANDDVEIEGVFIQARPSDLSATSEGEFDPDGTDKMAAVGCFDGTKNAISHKGGEVEVDELFVKWTPGTSTTDRKFVATVVMHEHDYSVMLESDVLAYQADCVQVDSGIKPNPNKKGEPGSTAASWVYTPLVTIATTLVAMLTTLI